MNIAERRRAETNPPGRLLQSPPEDRIKPLHRYAWSRLPGWRLKAAKQKMLLFICSYNDSPLCLHQQFR